MRAPASIRTRGYSRLSTAPPSSSAPGTSIRGSRPWSSRGRSGTSRTIATSATSPIGTLTRNSQRQPFSLAGQRDDRTAEDRTGTRGDRHGQPEVAEGRAALGAAEQLLDQPGVLRRQQPGRGALDQPGDHDQLGRGRQPDRRAGQHEPDQADHHQPAPAVRVAEPTTGDQGQPERQRVAGHDPLDRAGRGVEPRPHRRQGDVDDRDVEQRHEPDDQGHAEDPPTARVGMVGVRRRVGVRLHPLLGHPHSVPRPRQPACADDVAPWA